MSLLFARDLRDASLSSCLLFVNMYIVNQSLATGWRALTIIPLSNPVLDSSPLSEIRYLCPVFIGVRTGTEGTAGAVCGRILGRSRAGEGIRVAIVTLHDSDGGSLA